MSTVRAEGTFDFCVGCPAHNNCCVRRREFGYGVVEAAFIQEAEGDKIQRTTGIPLLTFSEKIHSSNGNETLALRTVDAKCYFYESGRCTIYEARPLDCRLFPFDIVELPDGSLWWIAYTDLCPKKFEFNKYFTSAKNLLRNAEWTVDEVRRYATHNATAMTKYKYTLIEAVT
jgi:Fe-S-cluster containining protein